MTTSGIIIDCEQGSDAWKQARCGLLTASRSADIIAAKVRGKGEIKARADYRGELIAERLTGKPVEQYVSREMEWGILQEPYARAAYEMQCGVLVDKCGFIRHPTIACFGASPDGLVGDQGMLQIKCPNTTTHLAWMAAGVVPLDHMPQMLGELACCPERLWSDFVSFDPRLPLHLQLFIRRWYRDQQLVMSLEREVLHFDAEVESVMRSLPQASSAVVLSMDAPRKDLVQ